MPRLMTDEELDAFEATRDIGAEILEGIDHMLANNAAKRSVPVQTDVVLARKKTGLTQLEFARMLDISRRTLEAWEQGKRNPSGAAKTLIKLCIQNPQAIKSFLMS